MDGPEDEESDLEEKIERWTKWKKERAPRLAILDVILILLTVTSFFAFDTVSDLGTNVVAFFFYSTILMELLSAILLIYVVLRFLYHPLWHSILHAAWIDFKKRMATSFGRK